MFFVISELNNEPTKRIIARSQIDNLTVDRLWSIWKDSEVYQWSTDHVCKWIAKDPYLHIYQENFRRNQFDGKMIPRLAANRRHYLTKIIQIKNPTHKQRISLMAMDLVLFGVPVSKYVVLSEHWTYIDMIAMCSTMVCIIIGIYAINYKIRSRQFIEHMKSQVEQMTEEVQAISDLKTYSRRISMYAQRSSQDNSTLLEDINELKNKARLCCEKRANTTDLKSRTILYEEEIKILNTTVRICEDNLKEARIQVRSDVIESLDAIKRIMDELFDFKRKQVGIMYNDSKKLMAKAIKKRKYLPSSLFVSNQNDMDDFDRRINNTKSISEELKSEMKLCNSKWEKVSSALGTVIKYKSTSLEGKQSSLN
ncbi:hypothetical protein GJ496_010633 [Pomphorhynchus laevis]|nr:hypothetical protein GJ496_010633 [Pomphorhynchus laevis]